MAVPKGLKYYVIKWKLHGGNERWVNSKTIYYVDKIYEFLEQRKLLAEANGEKNPRFSFSQIAKATGIYAPQVSTACDLLSQKEEQYVRLLAIAYPSEKGVKTSQKVELIKYRAKKKP